MSDAQNIIAIAALAAAADGNQSAEEKANISAAATRLGLSADDPRIVSPNAASLAELASALTNDDARVAAFDVARAVCLVDGPANDAESHFLTELSRALGAVPGIKTEEVPAVTAAAATAEAAPDLEKYILDQAILTAACELLPHRLSGMAILPLQLRMAYSIGQRHGHQFGMDQAKDLAAVVGIGAAGHMMEGIVRSVLGKVGKGMLGGLFGGAVGAAAGVSVTFATTYALGHAVQQYYTQGRKISTADLKALFERFRGEAQTMYPRVEARVKEVASTTDLKSLLGT